ncbi:uncharacterized protein EAE97_003411 [Botrytis byssoidea]|uniref:Uncharacterized protein n=1 Tax=Botrytis byssoidea TaxID=139641 RepID=A0A9P5IVE7_9HELO|nr:uncharacterized protein EAE97_003411 [Botrytis byssoidea]KAF7949902.1 hypothetical protein EAE97_003411 [Botrytis byssoidea]
MIENPFVVDIPRHLVLLKRIPYKELQGHCKSGIIQTGPPIGSWIQQFIPEVVCLALDLSTHPYLISPKPPICVFSTMLFDHDLLRYLTHHATTPNPKAI